MYIRLEEGFYIVGGGDTGPGISTWLRTRAGAFCLTQEADWTPAAFWRISGRREWNFLGFNTCLSPTVTGIIREGSRI